jgi:hypothetical protein
MFILTEDNLVYSQTGNSSCPGSSTWVHKWVVKGLVNGTTGTLLSTTDSWTMGNQVTTPVNYTLPAGCVDANCSLNMFIYKSTGGVSLTDTIGQSRYFTVTTGPTGINNQTGIATQYSLSQNYPNPFNPVTNIHFSIPKDGNVSLKFYDMLGNEVAVFADGFMKAGNYNAEFDGSNFASGTYFYTLKSNDFYETKKMILVK